MIENPTYTTRQGIELPLAPIPMLILQRWSTQYQRRCPKPRIPLRPVTYVDKVYQEPDEKNAIYLELLAEWNIDFEQNQLTYCFSRGVAIDPPIDWQADSELVINPDDPHERKALWVMSLLIDSQDISGLSEAIISLTMPTEKAVEEAKKGSE